MLIYCPSQAVGAVAAVIPLHINLLIGFRPCCQLSCWACCYGLLLCVAFGRGLHCHCLFVLFFVAAFGRRVAFGSLQTAESRQSTLSVVPTLSMVSTLSTLSTKHCHLKSGNQCIFANNQLLFSNSCSKRREFLCCRRIGHG